MDMHAFITNRNQFPPEELMKYAGRYVAWGPDGTRILASADEITAVAAQVDALGYDSDEVVLGFVPDPEEVILGGGGFLCDSDAEGRE